MRESALTGESLPVEKAASDLPAGKHGIADASNSVFLGTAVQTGMGSAVIVSHRQRIPPSAKSPQRLAMRPPETEFGRGIRHFGMMITRVIMLLVLFVLLVNIVFHRPLLESFLFSVALAVGMTPEMMPMIITITLAQGARRMARKKVLVKQLSAIEDFGSVEILCSDKTGTLTEGEIVLDRHVDVQGQDDENVLRFVYLNSLLSGRHQEPAGRRDPEARAPGDRASTKRWTRFPSTSTASASPWWCATATNTSSLPRARRRVFLPSAGPVIVDRDSAAVRRKPARPGGGDLPEVERRRVPHPRSRRAGRWTKQDAYTPAAEHDMTLAGFAAFLDPPKEGIPAVLEGAEAERRFRGDHDRRQPVRDAEGSPRRRAG